ncbi:MULTISPECIES: DUF4253 domain-containing protein [unclassified Duganella]|uniref:DUF4253 domain-containing protein n=1 Tax=unclassified Duganella TaxID=2636909 RepID=UPI000E3496AA|nr:MULTISPECIES: DUF4253 domain-containing protein [unclassified Duganella]RFP10613.1 DUF4253 domain-containing protein [Duganella sp. BJB475]
MGAWAVDAFGNDTACDWAFALAESEDLSLVRDTIGQVLDGEGPLDAGDGEVVLAAVETIARLRGHAGKRDAYSEPVDDWVLRTRIEVPDPLVAQAERALVRVLGENSELMALWEESGDAEGWRDSVAELRARLLAPAQALQEPAPRDPVAELLASIADIKFVQPEVGKNAALTELYRAIIAAGALGDNARVRALVARAHQTFANAGKETILWDIAVRDATSRAVEGQLADALAALEAWRGMPVLAEPGKLEGRLAGVCVHAGAFATAMHYKAQADAMSDGAPFVHLDTALLEARFGSPDSAAAILATLDRASLPDNVQHFLPFVEGLLACRRNEDRALGLLTTAMQGLLAGARSGPASWPIFGLCCGWWAVALSRGGQHSEARQLIGLVAPIMVNRFDHPLIAALDEHGILPDNGVLQPAPVADQGVVAPSHQTPQDHGAFKTLRVFGPDAMALVAQLRRAYAEGSGTYPFLIGGAVAVAKLKQMIEPPADGGAACIARARGFDLQAWLKEHAPARASWPKQAIAPQAAPQSLYEGLPGRLMDEIYIGLVTVDEPFELFARLGYGNWNGCPEPHIHAALHASWAERFEAEPLVVTDSVVECEVARPCAERAEALRLAREHTAYCDDIVEQGVGSTGKLASSLLASRYWYFWWD